MATQLTGRGILIVLLCFVILMGGMMLWIYSTSTRPSGPTDRQVVLATAVVTGLAVVWLFWLIFRSIQDYRHGVERAPARVGGWFHVFFGAAVALVGAGCSLLSYRNAPDPGSGIWTLYWGMIVWGLVQMALGGIKIRAQW
jgi:hypothetical protein